MGLGIPMGCDGEALNNINYYSIKKPRKLRGFSVY
jgi:hypothetical protein